MILNELMDLLNILSQLTLLITDAIIWVYFFFDYNVRLFFVVRFIVSCFFCYCFMDDKNWIYFVSPFCIFISVSDKHFQKTLILCNQKFSLFTSLQKAKQIIIANRLAFLLYLYSEECQYKIIDSNKKYLTRLLLQNLKINYLKISILITCSLLTVTCAYFINSILTIVVLCSWMSILKMFELFILEWSFDDFSDDDVFKSIPIFIYKYQSFNFVPEMLRFVETKNDYKKVYASLKANNGQLLVMDQKIQKNIDLNLKTYLHKQIINIIQDYASNSVGKIDC